MDTINLVNNGKAYFFRLDIAKESGQIARFTDWIKTRVSDNGKKVPIQWYDQGTVMNVHGFYPFIEGGVGKWIKDDDTGELAPSTDVVYRTWQGTPADTSDNGIAYYTLEDQFFTKQGEFVGTFGLRDDNGNNLTSVNLVFSVLGNDLRLTQAKDYYIKDLENLKRKFENDGNQAVADFNAKIEAGIETDRQALDALRASIQANRDGQASIAEQQAAITRQIKDQDIVTKTDYDNNIKTINESINARLSQMKTAPVGVADAQTLRNTYPNGADGIFLTLDTKHIWIWLNGQWTDGGVYQAQGLSQSDQTIIDNALKGLGTLPDPTVAPYNDLDTLPPNTIVTYPNIENVKHLPEVLQYDKKLGGITVTTYSYSKENYGGTVQVLHTNNNDRFWRIKWGENGGSYGNWNNPMFSNLDVVFADTLKPPFDDCNNLLDNTLTIYPNGLDHVSNSPEDVDHGAILTLNLRQDKLGKFQLLYFENKTYFRMWWGTQTSPYFWQLLTSYQMPPRLITSADNLDIPSKYQDLNTLPLNQIVTYATNSNLKNYPSNFGPATVITLGADLSGAVQIMIDSNTNLAIRICWGMSHIYTGWRRIGGYEPKPSLALFRSIGIIGDSYASGELAFDKNIDHYNMSWGQIMARRNGATAINFSRGGQTTRGWLSDQERGLGLLKSAPSLDLYILALGINDYGKLGQSYLGSLDDIGTNNDTFYGNYSKIIQSIKDKAPNSKIVISTLSQTGQLPDMFSNAIRNIAQHFEIPCLELNSDPFFTSDLYLNHLHGGHPTGPVYSGMAKAYERLIENSMVMNLDYFETFENGQETDAANDMERIKRMSN